MQTTEKSLVDIVMECLPILQGDGALVGRCSAITSESGYDISVGLRRPEGSVRNLLVASVKSSAEAVEITRRVNILTGNL
jgi:hypothetical protein